jgi:protein-disulfide isomerase
VKRLALILAAALVAIGAAPARDWTKVVVATPDGGYRVGNPAAKVKIVEYGSVWCPHCRHFHEEALPQLKSRYIATGKVSWELRNFVLNLPDMSATLLVQCRGLPAYFRTLDAFYAKQDVWQKGALEMSKADADRIDAMPEGQRMLGIARAMKLDAFVKPLGIADTQFAKCLTDQAAIARIEASNTRAVETYGVDGTPSFLINGKRVEKVYDWEKLEPALKAVL